MVRGSPTMEPLLVKKAGWTQRADVATNGEVMPSSTSAACRHGVAQWHLGNLAGQQHAMGEGRCSGKHAGGPQAHGAAATRF